MKKKPPPCNLDKYLEGRTHRYVTYGDGAREYSLPFWGFAYLAREADANIILRRNALADLDKIDAYIEANCKEDERSEEAIMPKKRRVIEDLEDLMKSGKKKYVRYAEGAQLYSMGLLVILSTIWGKYVKLHFSENFYTSYDKVGMVIVIVAMVVTVIGNLERDRLELA